MIEISNISKSYGGNGKAESRNAVLRNLSLTIRENEMVCILGPSGCGKSTLLNLIAGFIPPDCGRILFSGRPVTGPGPERGVIFQEPALFPWLKISRNIELGLEAKGMNKIARQAAAGAFLELVGLAGYENAYPHELSGGMKQRVSLARALALEPRALLMDEPFSALDAQTREHLQDELLRIWETHRKTVLFVTHNVAEAAYLAERIILMGTASPAGFDDIPVRRGNGRARGGREMTALAAELRRRLAIVPAPPVSAAV